MVIPDDWQEVRLGDIGRLRGGVGFPLHFQGRKTAAIPFYKVSDMNLPGNDIFMRDSNNWVSEADCRALGAAPLPAGSIVFAKVGAAVFLERKRILTRPSCVDNNMMALIPEVGRCDTRFLHFALQQVRFGDLVSATALPSINGSGVAGIVIPLPPRREQESIAEALGDADAAIEALDALIAKKRDVKQAAMQQLLAGRTRLPGFAEEWVDTTLGGVAQAVSGGTPSTGIAAYWDGGIPWCTPTDITATRGRYLRSTERTITQLGISSSGASLLPAGSLLLCTRATIGEVRIAGQSTSTNQGFKSLVVRPGTSNIFLYYLVQTLRPRFIERASGSTFLEIGRGDLISVAIRVPREDEQEAIAHVLSDMDDELDALVAQRDKMRLVKQGMMQELLSGRVRLV